MNTYTSLDASSRRPRVWHWLKSGSTASFGWSSYRAISRPQPWAVPWRVWRALARHRRVVPSPLLYLVVAVLGLLVGIVLQFAFGIWWWLPPLALLVVAWLIAFTSIWWSPRDRTGVVRAAILSVINPQRWHEERRREQRELLLASGLPLFELESWTGAVTLAGYGGPSERITEISVGLCDTVGPVPVVFVTTISDEAEHENFIRERLLDELSGRNLDELVGPGPTPEAIGYALAKRREELRELSWAPVTFHIDGRAHHGAAFRGPLGSVAYCAVGDLWVTVEGVLDVDYRLRKIADSARIIDAV